MFLETFISEILNEVYQKNSEYINHQYIHDKLKDDFEYVIKVINNNINIKYTDEIARPTGSTDEELCNNCFMYNYKLSNLNISPDELNKLNQTTLKIINTIYIVGNLRYYHNINNKLNTYLFDAQNEFYNTI